MAKFHQILWVQPKALEALMLGINVIDRDREMTVAITVYIGFVTPLIDGQLDFKMTFIIAQIDKFEVVEIETIRNPKAERLFVKVNGAVHVEHTKHGVNYLGHAASSSHMPVLANTKYKHSRTARSCAAASKPV
jgi:hypothetical protein